MVHQKKWRRLKLGLQTLLGGHPKGFFIPYRYADGIIPGERHAGYPSVKSVFAQHVREFEGLLHDCTQFMESYQAFGSQKPPFPRWEQNWFPGLDGVMAYGMVRLRRPRLIVEVGSGHSTRFMAQAIKDEALGAEIISIDPAPRADIKTLDFVAVTEQTIQAAGPKAFQTLRSGDILFIDSSHILMPGSDVDILFNQIIPLLETGVIIHIHDITLPDHYPKSWHWREYNEQLGVIPMILGEGYGCLWSSHFMRHYAPKVISALGFDWLPVQKEALETSLWLIKR